MTYPSRRREVEIHADRIASLTAENERLREALREIVGHCNNDGCGNPIVNERIIDRCEATALAAIGDE